MTATDVVLAVGMPLGAGAWWWHSGKKDNDELEKGEQVL